MSLRTRLRRLYRSTEPPADCDGCGGWWTATQLAWRHFGSPPTECPLCRRRPPVFGPPGAPPALDAASWRALEREAVALARKHGLPDEAGLQELHQLLGHARRR